MSTFFGWFFLVLAGIELAFGIAFFIAPAKLTKPGQPVPSRLKIYFATCVSVAISITVSVMIFALTD